MKPPLLLLRVDVSREHGTGHLMRCKALADAWVKSGGAVTLATTTDVTPYAVWLGAIMIHRLDSPPATPADAQETAALSRSLCARWAAVDGYPFSAEWQMAFGEATPLLFFDDYGHGAPHTARMVLNQNPSASPALYPARSQRTVLLLGSRYALLREQFQKWIGWKRPHPARAKRLLATFGGTDPSGITLRVVRILAAIPDLETELVVGAGNLHGEEIEGLCRGTAIRVRKNVTDMPSLIAECDFALCAAGSTTLELAFLQTPQILIAVADNQRALAASLHAAGAALHLGWHTEIADLEIANAITTLQADGPRLAAMSAAGAQLVDGHGGARVVVHLRADSLGLRPAETGDVLRLYKWANDPATRAASFSSAPIAWEAHQRWFAERLADPSSRLFILSDGETPAAIARFSIEHQEATISVLVAPGRRGSGLGAPVILRASHECFRASGVQRIVAFIRPENAASRSVFVRAGYHPVGSATVSGQPAERYHLERNDIPAHALL